MTRYNLPHAPAARTGDWSVSLPPSASIGELIVYASVPAPVAPVDWTLYVPCDTDYAADPASTDPWITPTATIGSSMTHPDGGPVCIPSTLTDITTNGPPYPTAGGGPWHQHTWSVWLYQVSGTPGGFNLHGEPATNFVLAVIFNMDTITGSSVFLSDGQVVLGDFTVYHQTPGTYTAGNWHQVVAVESSAGTWDIYIDGALNTAAFVGDTAIGDADLFEASTGPGRTLARIKHWARALTAGEIAALYAANG